MNEMENLAHFKINWKHSELLDGKLSCINISWKSHNIPYLE